MKVLRIFCVILLSTLLFSCCTTTEVSRFKIFFGNLTWKQAKRVGNTPRMACFIVRKHIKYVSDKVKADEWLPGKETWKRGGGDCEDFAVAVWEICYANDLDAHVYVFKSEKPKAAHAVVIGKYKGKMWLSSNGSYEVIESLDDAVKYHRKMFYWKGKITYYRVFSWIWLFL